MRPLSSRSPIRGQTSVEILLIMGFILLVSTLLGMVYVENQSKTNVSIQTKLLVLPYLERNGYVLKIAEIKSTVIPSRAVNDLQVVVRTKGKIQTNLVKSADCAYICSNIDPVGYYNSVSFQWTNQEGNLPAVFLCGSALAPVAC